jgi:proteasome lid subunit RPN8/RPN11
MNWLSEQQRQTIARFSTQRPEEESCGFVLEDGSVVECVNIAENTREEFEISARDYTTYDLIGIKGVWHSHLELPGFSAFDQEVISTDTLPWAVYCLANDSFTQVDPTMPAPLVGRPFCFGLYDCYSLISDKLQEMGVQCPSWPRQHYGEWDEPQFFHFDEQAIRHGRPVTDGQYQEGDVLLLNLGGHPGHADHVGVFVDHQRFLHHPAGKLSRIDRFGSWWERRLRLVVRPTALWNS